MKNNDNRSIGMWQVYKLVSPRKYEYVLASTTTDKALHTFCAASDEAALAFLPNWVKTEVASC